ncbi:MAG: hypothetical protein NC254_13180 [bacterium]|nr:hypothetical protein [bacterium]
MNQNVKSMIGEYDQDGRSKERNKFCDISELMIINLEETRSYYKLSKRMVGLSFVLSVFLCVSGFGLIAVPVISSYAAGMELVQVSAPIIGGIVVEIVAGISLLVYKKSLEQIERYYEDLHNNEKFLTSIQIIGQLSDNKKDEIYGKIMEDQLGL